MSVTELRITDARDHEAALMAAPSKADQARYGVSVVAPLDPAGTQPKDVRAWLLGYGVDIVRPTISKELTAWKRAHGVPATPAAGITVVTDREETMGAADGEGLPSATAYARTDAVSVTPTVRLTGVPATQLVSPDAAATPPRTVLLPDTDAAQETAAPVVVPEPVGQVDYAHDLTVSRDATGMGDAYEDRSEPRGYAPDADATPGPLRVAGQADRPADPQPAPMEITPQMRRLSRRLGWPGYALLTVVAVSSFALSYESLQSKAAEVFGGKPGSLAHWIGYGLPLATDLLIVGASLAYLAGAVLGRGQPGWRMASHAAIGATIVLNALAAGKLAYVPWHVIGPIAYAWIVEVAARDLLREHRRQVEPEPERPTISLLMWLTSPITSAREYLTALRLRGYARARVVAGADASARLLLAQAAPGPEHAELRRHIARQIKTGSITAAEISDLAWDLIEHPGQDATRVLQRMIWTSGRAGGDATKTRTARTSLRP